MCNSEEGFIKIYRSLSTWAWADDPYTLAFWIHLLLEANWEDREWHGMVVKRGSLVASISSLAKKSGLSIQQARTAIKRLEANKQITREPTNQYTLITICKYDDYQSRGKSINTRDNTQSTNEQQTSNKRATTPKEYKEVKNINITNTNNAHTYTRDWRFVSSVQRDILGFDKDKIAEYKRGVFREQVELLAPQVKMTPKQVDAFVRFWTEHSPGNENLRADLQPTFDIRDRMLTWKEREKPDIPKVGTPPPSESRMDALKKDLNFIHEFFNGTEQSDTTPDEQ